MVIFMRVSASNDAQNMMLSKGISCGLWDNISFEYYGQQGWLGRYEYDVGNYVVCVSAKTPYLGVIKNIQEKQSGKLKEYFIKSVQ